MSVGRFIRKSLQFLRQWSVTQSTKGSSVGSIVEDLSCSLSLCHTHTNQDQNTFLAPCFSKVKRRKAQLISKEVFSSSQAIRRATPLNKVFAHLFVSEEERLSYLETRCDFLIFESVSKQLFSLVWNFNPLYVKIFVPFSFN